MVGNETNFKIIFSHFSVLTTLKSLSIYTARVALFLSFLSVFEDVLELMLSYWHLEVRIYVTSGPHISPFIPNWKE